MNVEYNGVNLELLTLDRVTRTAVYDSRGVDLLYVRWVLGMACVYSPGGYPVGTAVTGLSDHTVAELNERPSPFVAQNPVRGIGPKFEPITQESNVGGNQSGPGLFAVYTDKEINFRLMTPRRTLRIFVYDRTGKKVSWLVSPRPGDRADACYGPKPISCDIVQANGEGVSFGVYFQIETCLTPCPDGSDRFILSHHWVMSHDHDDDYYLTRTIRGEVVFNGAQVNALAQNPDWFRNQFMHPIPVGMRRRGPHVELSGDGLTLSYVVQDYDPTITFDPGDSGATQMQIIEQLGYSQPFIKVA